ncbi:MAG: methyl-accepting chemotaxis protein [Geobacteraceae bacterium]|nr:methyl-accepting chemotaxis protein [Geobacteraceae bacterium]
MDARRSGRHRGLLYASIGFSMIVVAPVFWALLHALFFYQPDVPLWSQLTGDFTSSTENILLYCYIGLGAAIIASVSGYILGKSGDQLRERAGELESLNDEVVSQKELFEERYRALDGNIKKFHRISTRIQKSLEISEVMSLCAEGLHDVLGFERVNILMADPERAHLHFLLATGSEGFDLNEAILPLDHRIGVIHKCFSEQKLYLIDDIGKCSPDYYLQSPYNTLKPLRSRSFVLCPIVVKGESVGLFGIDNAYSRRLANESDEDTIKLFADQAAAAIVRIDLLKAIDTLTSELDNTFSGFLQKQELFSHTVYSLKAAIDSLFDGTARIAHASESVMSSVEETSSAVGQISISIDQVTSNLNFLADAIEKSVSAMEEMHASIKNVGKNAAVSHEVSQQVRLQADAGREKVGETIAALEEIQRSVDLSFDGIMRLSENSGRIGNIVKVIKDITKKTNLLALNASIIAAQAGEFGKDFGVVAEEMRALSHQTGQITGEIAVIISYILNDSDTAARNITFSKELVQKGVEIGNATGDTLKIIHQSAVRSMQMTEEIKTATEEQVRGVQLVTHSIEDVSAMASQIYTASKEQSGATKNIIRSIESIKDMAMDVVKATEAQVRDGSEIEESVESHVQTSAEIFESMELRRQQSVAVMEQLEVLKGVST